MSGCPPNTNPSYHFFTFSFSPDIPCSSSAVKTSGSVKPKEVAYLADVVVMTSMLFKSEKMDSLLTLVMPVMIPRSRYGFVLNVALNRLLVKETSFFQ